MSACCYLWTGCPTINPTTCLHLGIWSWHSCDSRCWYLLFICWLDVLFLDFCCHLLIIAMCGGCRRTGLVSPPGLLVDDREKYVVLDRGFSEELRGSFSTPKGVIHRELEVWWEEGIQQIAYSITENYLERQGW